MDSALINLHYVALGIHVQPEDLLDQRSVFISENRVGSKNVDLVLKVYCEEEISIFDAFSGAGQFDHIIVQLSPDFLVLPEHDIGMVDLY